MWSLGDTIPPITASVNRRGHSQVAACSAQAAVGAQAAVVKVLIWEEAGGGIVGRDGW